MKTLLPAPSLQATVVNKPELPNLRTPSQLILVCGNVSSRVYFMIYVLEKLFQLLSK